MECLPKLAATQRNKVTIVLQNLVSVTGARFFAANGLDRCCKVDLLAPLVPVDWFGEHFANIEGSWIKLTILDQYRIWLNIKIKRGRRAC
jgi:hypothetical protein